MKKKQVDEQLVVDIYKQVKDTFKVAQIFGLSKSSIYRILKKLNIQMNKSRRRKNLIPLNENYFSIIDSEEKAYWLGFIAADGNVRQNKSGSWEFSIHLAIKDYNHLEKFALALGNKQLVKINNKNKHPSVKIRIVRKKMVDDLISNGIVPNKTKVGINLPNFCDKLIIHWLRGYIDGDGSFMRRKKNNTLAFSVVSSTEYFIKQIKQLFYGFNIIGGFCGEIKGRNCWRLSYEGKKAVNIAKLIYEEGNIYLERKRNIAIN